MKEKDFRSGRQWSVRDQGQGFKGHQRSYRLCSATTSKMFFKCLSLDLYFIKKPQKVEFKNTNINRRENKTKQAKNTYIV